ncbi:hypothetical protein [Mucilaginibacter gotjawali]|uniref:Uncharacterized protein n=2 Tax=Mucilaginibacter gotjawali TaxID=1550579 RepID=A0A110AZN7_9SPHI|nr:hypothetical protein [Mucilaginibacter gotjawali]MBB3054280.1 hypothetical protein [Mucilaginibacter gotjawali]BAU51885.1 hypothetical protein MgSA37_00034 [Mucilaginibacter gotjawali]
MIQEINNLNDVAGFMHNLVEEGVNAHPDELFENYVKIETGEPSFSAGEAAFRNQLMEKSFEICEQQGIDIYSFMQEIFLIDTGLDKYIPLPSQS